MDSAEKTTQLEQQTPTLGSFNLFVSLLSDEAQQRRDRIARNRRQPTDRRRTFFQELAIAVADEMELRAAVDEKINREYADADNAQQTAQQLAADAAFAADHPLEAAFDKTRGYRIGRADWGRPTKEKIVLRWAIEEGILPLGTTEIPDTETQYLVLAKPRLSHLSE